MRVVWGMRADSSYGLLRGVGGPFAHFAVRFLPQRSRRIAAKDAKKKKVTGKP